MTIDSTQRLQSLYVPVSDGVRLAVDVWLPVERIARGERVGTAFRATRYHRAEQRPSPGPRRTATMRPENCGPAPGSRWSSPTREAPALRSARAPSSSGHVRSPTTAS